MRKILIGDDHAILRLALKNLIIEYLASSDIEEASDACTVFEKIKFNEFNLIILGVDIAGEDSIPLVQEILAFTPGAKILMYSCSSENIFARKYLQLGAMGYVTKSTSESDIRIAIDNVLHNKKYLSASLISLLTAT